MSMQAPPFFPCFLETPVTVSLPASSKWLCCLLRSSVCAPVACFPVGKRERPLGRSIQCPRAIDCLPITSRGLRELRVSSHGWHAPFAILHASWYAFRLLGSKYCISARIWALSEPRPLPTVQTVGTCFTWNSKKMGFISKY